jgi:hypothetical protein
MKLTNLCYAASAALAVCLTQTASAQNWTWTGLGNDDKWSDAANWDQGTVPPPTAGDIYVNPVAYPGPVVISATDVVQNEGTMQGPEWGQTLDIYGTVIDGYALSTVGVIGGPTSVANLYGNASVTTGDSVFIGDPWWFAGIPNGRINVYDNATLATHWLQLAGHLNIYGGTVIISNGFLTGTSGAGPWGSTATTDATRRANMAGGTLVIMGSDATSVIQDAISRGIFTCYGKTGDTNSGDLTITYDGSNTTVTNVGLGGNLQSVFIEPLAQPTMAAGTFQQAKLLGNYPNVTNVLLSTTDPGVDPATLPGGAIVAFASSNPSVFTVDTNGVVTAVSAGHATLSATMGTYSNGVTVTVTAAVAPTLLHRYSFNDAPGSTSAADSVGGSKWAATLNGDAAISGGNLVLSGNVGSGATLPAGIVSNLDAVSVEAWATFPSTLGSYTYLFAFGQQDTDPDDYYYGFGGNDIMLSPCATTNIPGNLQASFELGLPGYNNGRDAVATGGSLANQANVHIVAVFNPLAGYVSVYTNAVLAATFNTQFSWLVLENFMPDPLPQVLGDDPVNYIGQSLYPASDTNGLLADIDEFRIYSGALTPGQIAADYALGPNQLIGSSTSVSLSAVLSGSNLIVKWPTSSALVTLLSSPTLGAGATWTQVAATVSLDGSGNYKVTVPATSGTQFFRLQR